MALIMVFVLGFAALFALGAGRGAEGLSTTLLQGPDDQMRMVQVLDWLNGQAWADTTQRRLDPPDGVPMHWSRIADLPVAALILTFELLADREAAAVWAAMLAPALLGGLFAALFVWAALPLTEGRALVPVLMIGALVIPFQQFLPGRIDHHGLQLTLTVLALGCLLRVLIHHSNWAAVGIGIAGALSLAIGLEALPFLGAATLALTLAWIVAGDAGGARGLAVFGVSLAAATLALIHLTLPPDAWVVAACDRISLAHVGLTAIVPAAGLGALALALWRPEAGWALRFALMAVIGVTGLALVALAFPHCVGSPYAGLPAEVRYWFEKVSEAQPFHLYFLRKPGAAVAFAVLPVAALVSLILCWTRTTDRRTALWPGLLVLVLSGFALLLWQIRGVTYAALTAGLGLIPFAAAVNDMADRARSILARVGLRVAVPMLAVIAVMAPYALITPEAQQQKDATAGAGCEVEAAREALNDPAGLGARPLTIAAPVDAGPAVLLLSPHRVLAAPYHRNVQGLVDNRRIFAGTEDEALRTIARRKVGAILFCRKHAALSVYDGQPAFLNERLAENQPPAWLEPVMAEGGLSLYRVRAAESDGRGTNP